MTKEEIVQLREEFAAGEVRILRLATEDTLEACADAAGVSVATWWRWENSESPVGPRNAPAAARVVERLRAGEHIGARVDSTIYEQAREERAQLQAIEDFLRLSAASAEAEVADLWDNPRMAEARRTARRVLAKRRRALGIEPPEEE